MFCPMDSNASATMVSSATVTEKENLYSAVNCWECLLSIRKQHRGTSQVITISTNFPASGLPEKMRRPGQLSPQVNIKRVMRRRNSQKTPQMAAGYLRHAVCFAYPFILYPLKASIIFS